MKNKFALLLAALITASAAFAPASIVSFASDSAANGISVQADASAAAGSSENAQNEETDTQDTEDDQQDSLQQPQAAKQQTVQTQEATEGTSTSEQQPQEKAEENADTADAANTGTSQAEADTTIESDEKTEESATAKTEADAAAVQTRWSADRKTYYVNGSPLRNTWAQIDGKYYYFNSNGTIHTGGLNMYSNWYNFNSNGTLMSNKLVRWKGKTYFYGATANGSGSGRQVTIPSYSTGSSSAGSTTFYASYGARLKNTWAQIDGKYYYFNSNETARTGGLNMYSNWYNFNSDGTLMSNKLVRWKGKTYFYGATANGSGSGRQVTIPSYSTGSSSAGSTTFYASYGARLKNTWAQIDGKYYYFNSNETARTGGLNMYSNWYNFNSNGTLMSNKLVRWKGKTYFYGATANGSGSGRQVTIPSYSTGSSSAGSTTFYASYGARLKNTWAQIDGKYYYFNSNETARTGGLNMYSNWYNFNSNGTLMLGQFVKWKGKKYYYAPASGTSGQKITIKSYATSANSAGNVTFYTSYGARLKNTTREINGIKYTFGADGSVKSEVVIDSVQNYTSDTNYLIVCKKNSKTVTVYKKQNGAWVVYRSPMKCSVGAIKNGKSLTPTGAGRIVYKRYKMNFVQTTGFYVSWTNRGVGFHTILYKKGSSSPSNSNLVDGRLGINISKGCIRLSVTNAKWVYDNVPVNTAVQLLNK